MLQEWTNVYNMYKITRHELALDVNQIAIKDYNKMHFHYWIRITNVQLIIGLKHKWRWLMKIFDSTKLNYNHPFQVIILIINVSK